MTNWIEDWFGSEYYSLLYKGRDCNEAKLLLDNLISYLKISSKDRILDCGCGQGRHSIYLSEIGLEVTGIDLCESNVEKLKKNKKKNLTFHTHDIRNTFRINYYDAVLNLFTSFGYYNDDSENNKVIKSLSGSLKKKGWLVLDFMNAVKEIKELKKEEKFEMSGIAFEVKRFADGNFITKEITVCDKGKRYLFREQVKSYKQKDLENFFIQNNLEVVHLFGDYHLHSFHEATSKRLIIIGRKN